MNLDDAKSRARAYIKELALDEEEQIAMERGMLILEDAINGEL